MTWESPNIINLKEQDSKSFVSISLSHITFNSMFGKIAELDKYRTVKIEVDLENFRLRFKFDVGETPNSLTLMQKRKGAKTFIISSVGIISQYPWIKAVANFPDPQDRHFSPTNMGGYWVIQLCPAFEIKKARESEDIPSNLQGIYQYVRENGEIVYIGRGQIKERLMSPERKDWDFDEIRYSIVSNPDQQVKWEGHWIERFQKVHNGKLPFYNRISGSS